MEGGRSAARLGLRTNLRNDRTELYSCADRGFVFLQTVRVYWSSNPGEFLGWEKIEYRLIKHMVQRTDVIRNLQPYIKNCIATCKYVHWKHFACSFWIDFWTFEAYLSWDFFWKKTWKGPLRRYTHHISSLTLFMRGTWWFFCAIYRKLCGKYTLISWRCHLNVTGFHVIAADEQISQADRHNYLVVRHLPPAAASSAAVFVWWQVSTHLAWPSAR